MIDLALCVGVIENLSPADHDEVGLHGLVGDVRNRWADKAHTAISYANGWGNTSTDVSKPNLFN